MSEQLDSLVRHIRESVGENMLAGVTKNEACEQGTAFHTIAILIEQETVFQKY
jgi:hypothetical protein